MLSRGLERGSDNSGRIDARRLSAYTARQYSFYGGARRRRDADKRERKRERTMARGRFLAAREIARGGVSIQRALARATLTSRHRESSSIRCLSSRVSASRLLAFFAPRRAPPRGGEGERLKALNERTIIEICFPAGR